jgi:hypothetical protein
MKPTKIEKAWAAGFFEGEGSIQFNRSKNTSNRTLGWLIIEITQVDPSPLEWLNERWPGRSYWTNQKSKNARPFFRWERTSTFATSFLRDIQPFIVRPLMQKKIDLALAFQAQKTRTHDNRLPEYRDRQTWFVNEMLRLNLRGKAALSTRV